jgi:hypothetical protein
MVAKVQPCKAWADGSQFKEEKTPPAATPSGPHPKESKRQTKEKRKKEEKKMRPRR